MLAKHLIKRIIYDQTTPGSAFVPDSNDVMLVSYPKSGNTWVRALVSQTIRPDASLQDMELLVPDIYRTKGRFLRKAYRFPTGGRLIKSHECFRPTYRRVIYVTRDPRDVCVSYYHYLRKVQRQLSSKANTLDQFASLFLSGQTDAYGTWAEHVRSWGSMESTEILHIRYEDMLRDTKQILVDICDFLEFEAADEILSSAVAKCSIESLQRKEKTERSKWSVVQQAEPEAKFFRSGRSNNWSEISKFTLDAMYSRWGQDMKRLGYEI